MISPEIRQPPKSTVTDLATSVSLTCIAQGHPAPIYEWYKDDALVPGETRSVLNIAEPSPHNRGNYTCKAINSKGEMASEPANLDIQGRTVIKKMAKHKHYSLRICRYFAVFSPAEFIDHKSYVERGVCINIAINTYVIMLL